MIESLKEHKNALKCLFLKNPCKKCIVRPMCTAICEEHLVLPAEIRRWLSLLYLLTSVVWLGIGSIFIFGWGKAFLLKILFG